MTILEDGANEWQGEFGVDVTIYPHQGYSDQGQDIWQTDQGWSGSGTTYTVVIYDDPSDEMLTEEGFSSDVELMFWTTNGSNIKEGDQLDWQNRNWVISEKNVHIIQGRAYKYSFAAVSQEQ